MKFGLFATLALAIGAIATHFLLQDNGYVLFSFRGYTVEMSVPILVFFLALAYLAVRLVARILAAPRQLGEAAGRARARRAGKQVTDGYIALAEGRLARGERLLTRGARESDAPILNYLAAARAAQMQGDSGRRDEWLRLAREKEPGATNAVLLTQAELQMQEGQYEQARASLARIREKKPEHSQALRLLAKLCREQDDHAGVAELLPLLRKQKYIPAATLDEWSVEAYQGLLSQDGLNRTAIEQYWQQLPRPLRKHPELISARIHALAASGDDGAGKEIRKALKHDWRVDLVLLYGQIGQGDASTRLKHAEGWLRQRPEDPALLLTAGRLCIRNELWGKARSYLESSIAIQPTPAAYHELGQLMLKVGETESASSAFQRGLALQHGGSPDTKRLTQAIDEDEGDS